MGGPTGTSPSYYYWLDVTFGWLVSRSVGFGVVFLVGRFWSVTFNQSLLVSRMVGRFWPVTFGWLVSRSVGFGLALLVGRFWSVTFNRSVSGQSVSWLVVGQSVAPWSPVVGRGRSMVGHPFGVKMVRSVGRLVISQSVGRWSAGGWSIGR